MDFKIKKEFQGSIITIADEVLNYSKIFNDVSAKIVPGEIARVEQESFPGACLREGILNAICHADYSLPSNIKIEFFRDKAKIINPGNVFHSTLEAVLGGIQTFRNPGLVNILYKLGFIENYGTGLQRIREAYEKEEVKPEFKVIDRYFFLTLPNLNKDSYSFECHDAQSEVQNDAQSEVQNDAQSEAQSGVEINEQKKSVYETIITLIKYNPKITRKMMAQKIGVSKTTIERVLAKNKNIKYVGSSKNGHWEILENDKK